MYFVSSVLLMRMNLPLMYRKAITEVRPPQTLPPLSCRYQHPDDALDLYAARVINSHALPRVLLALELCMYVLAQAT